MPLGARRLFSQLIKAGSRLAEVSALKPSERNGSYSAESIYRFTELPSWRGPPRPLLKPNPAATASLKADLIEIGDVVELETDTKQLTLSLVTWSPIGETFDAIDLQGDVFAANVSSVRFVLKRAFVTQQSSWTPPLVSRSLKGLVVEALQKAKLLEPYIQVAHAKVSLDSQMRAVDFERLCEILFESYAMGGEKRQISCSDRLAVYLATTKFDPNFTRFDKGPLLAVSTKTSDNIHKVLESQSRTDFDLFINALTSRLQQKDAIVPAAADPFVDVLKHYMVTCDPKLNKFVQHVFLALNMEPTCVPSASAVEQLLSATGLISGNPFLEGGLLASTLSSGCQLNLERAENLPPTVPFPQAVYKLADDFGVAVDSDRLSDRKVVSFHIPYVPVSSVLGIRSVTSIRGKSLNTESVRIPLLSDAIKDKFKFKAGEEATCLSISAEINNWDEKWDPRSVRVSFSSCQVEAMDFIEFFEGNQVNLPGEIELETPMYLKELITRYSDKSLPDFDTTYAAANDMANGLRVLAGQWMAAYSQRENLQVPFLYKGVLKEFPHTNEPGTVEVEQIRSTPGEYGPLGINGYVPVAFPFDSSLALVVQSAVLKALKGPSKGPQREIALTCNRNLLPGAELTHIVYNRLKRYETLKALEKGLDREFGFQIFRCTISETATEGRIHRAHCIEIDLDVDVLVNASLAPGDNIICTEILDLDPLRGHLLLRM